MTPRRHFSRASPWHGEDCTDIPPHRTQQKKRCGFRLVYKYSKHQNKQMNNKLQQRFQATNKIMIVLLAALLALALMGCFPALTSGGDRELESKIRELEAENKLLKVQLDANMSNLKKCLENGDFATSVSSWC
jgi:hypothetical protein